MFPNWSEFAHQTDWAHRLVHQQPHYCWYFNHSFSLSAFRYLRRAALSTSSAIKFEIAASHLGSNCWRQFFCLVKCPTLFTTNHFNFASFVYHLHAQNYSIVFESSLVSSCFGLSRYPPYYLKSKLPGISCHRWFRSVGSFIYSSCLVDWECFDPAGHFSADLLGDYSVSVATVLAARAFCSARNRADLGLAGPYAPTWPPYYSSSWACFSPSASWPKMLGPSAGCPRRPKLISTSRRQLTYSLFSWLTADRFVLTSLWKMPACVVVYSASLFLFCCCSRGHRPVELLGHSLIAAYLS